MKKDVNAAPYASKAWLLLACLVFICLGSALPGHARPKITGKTVSQEAPAQGQKIAGVVVTAQKREESVQEVPISMSVLTSSDIEEAGIFDVTDLTYFTPNVYSKQNTNQNMLIIRGISSHNVILNTPAGLFVDEINYPMTFMQNPDLMDIERVEVLRGPQGTLYGRNTESGAVRIITRQPGNQVRGSVFLEPGFYDTPHDNPFFLKAGASVSGPVVEDNLYFGVSLLTKDTDGFTENIYDLDDKAGKVDHKTGQAKLRWTPGEKWDISLLANAYKTDDGYGYLRLINGPAQSDRYKTNWDGVNHWKDENNGQALSIKYQGRTADVVAITTRNDYETDFANDGEFGPYPYPDQYFVFTSTIYSQEIRLSSPDEKSPLKWLTGLYGFTEDVDATAKFFNQARKTEYDNKGYAVFGQATYTLFDRLHLTAGLRYDDQKSDGTQTFNMLPDSYSKDLEHSEVLPKGSVSFDISDDVMLYATVAKGFLAGGYNYAFAEGRDNLTFGPEKTWNYEVGFKSTWLDSRIRLNASLFYVDISDKQVEEYLAGPAVRSVTNAAKASSKGFELELEARPAPGWRFFGGIGYADAVIDDWVSAETTGGSYDYDDKRLPYAPQFTFNAGLDYTHQSGLFGRVDMTGISDFYTEAKNDCKVEGYQLINLRLGYQAEDFGVALWCQNLFDKEYFKSKSTYLVGDIGEDGDPRTIGVRFTYRF